MIDVLSVEQRLRAAARLDAITRDRVRAYCNAIGERDHRIEGALLRNALETVVVGELIDGLIDSLKRRLAEVPSRRVSVLLDGYLEPRSVRLERLVLLGRTRQRTRVYLLYWRRLRDWLIWSVGDLGAPALATQTRPTVRAAAGISD